MVGDEDAVGGLQNLIGGDGLHLLERTFGGLHLVEKQRTTPYGEHLVEFGLVGDGQLSDELLLCGVQLYGAQLLGAEFLQFFISQINTSFHLLFVAADIYGEKTAVGKRRVVGLHRVGEAPSLADAYVEAGAAGLSAQQVGEQRQGQSALLLEREGGVAQHHMRLCGVLVLHQVGRGVVAEWRTAVGALGGDGLVEILVTIF